MTKYIVKTTETTVRFYVVEADDEEKAEELLQSTDVTELTDQAVANEAKTEYETYSFSRTYIEYNLGYSWELFNKATPIKEDESETWQDDDYTGSNQMGG